MCSEPIYTMRTYYPLYYTYRTIILFVILAEQKKCPD